MGGGSIFAVIVMAIAVLALVAFGDWVDGHIDEALDEALRPNPTTDEPKED